MYSDHHKDYSSQQSMVWGVAPPTPLIWFSLGIWLYNESDAPNSTSKMLSFSFQTTKNGVSASCNKPNQTTPDPNYYAVFDDSRQDEYDLFFSRHWSLLLRGFSFPLHDNIIHEEFLNDNYSLWCCHEASSVSSFMTYEAQSSTLSPFSSMPMAATIFSLVCLGTKCDTFASITSLIWQAYVSFAYMFPEAKGVVTVFSEVLIQEVSRCFGLILELPFEVQSSLPTSDSSPVRSFVKKFSDGLSKWNEIRNSPIASKISNCISMIISAGLCQAANLKFSVSGFKIFAPTLLQKHVSVLDAFSCIAETVIGFLDGGYKAFTTGSISYMLGYDDDVISFEEKYTDLARLYPYALTGNLDLHTSSTIGDFEALLVEVLDAVNRIVSRYAKNPTSFEYTMFNSKRLKIQEMDAEYRTTAISGQTRIRPYAIVLWGGTSTGKSTLTDKLIESIQRYNGLDAGPTRTAVFPDGQAFASNVRSSHNAIVFDDGGNTHPDFVETPITQHWLHANNNTRHDVPQAEAHLKGRVKYNNLISVATTNTYDGTMNAEVYSIDATSNTRRAHLNVQVKNRPEYTKDGMLDEDKAFRDFPSGIADVYLLTVRKVSVCNARNGKAFSEYKVLPGYESCDIYKFLRLIQRESAAHYERQRLMLESKKEPLSKCDLCSCYGCPGNCEPFEQQLGWYSVFRHFARHYQFYFLVYNVVAQAVIFLCTPVGIFYMLPRWIPMHCRVFFVLLVKWLWFFFRPFSWIFPLIDYFFGGPTIYREEAPPGPNPSDAPGARDGRWFNPRYIIPNPWRYPTVNGPNRITQSYLALRDRARRFNFPRLPFVLSRYLEHPRWLEFVAATATDTIAAWNYWFIVATSFVFNALIYLATWSVSLSMFFSTPFTVVATAYIYALHYVVREELWTNIAQPNVELVRDTIREIRRHHNSLLLGAAGVTTFVTFCSYYRWYKSTYAFEAQGNLAPTSDADVEARNDEKNPYVPVVVKPLPVSHEASTTPYDVMLTKVHDSLLHVTTDKGVVMDAFMLASNLMLVPCHFIDEHDGDFRFTAVRFKNVPSSIIRGDIIGTHNTYRVPGTDFAIVTLTKAGCFPDLVKWLPLATPERGFPASFSYKDSEGGVDVMSTYVEPYHNCAHVDRHGRNSITRFMGSEYTLPKPTFSGMCMSVVISRTKSPFIAGFHLGGSRLSNDCFSPRGVLGLLTADDVSLAIRYFDSKVVTPVLASEGTFDSRQCGVDVLIHEDIHYKSPVNFLTSPAQYTVYGTCSGRTKPRSSVESTGFSNRVEEIFGIPNLWGPPKFGPGTYPYQADRKSVV